MQLEGILTAMVTPFDESDHVNHDVLSQLIAHQLDCGVSGFVPLGSTGESYALTETERSDVLATFKDTAGDHAQLVAGANAPNTRDVIEQVKKNRDAGYDAVLVAPPFYSVPSPEELLKHYEAILEAVPDVEIVLYNYPQRVAIELDYSVLDGLKEHPRVIAIKESSGDLMRAIEIGMNYENQIDLACGSDDVALDFFLWGAKSWISAPANVLAREIVAFYNRFTSGDVFGAKEISQRIFPFMKSIESGKLIQKIKYGCELQGFAVGPGRLPLQPLSSDEKAAFKRAFDIATQG
jgi:4-hydroxy-tetrahydrodipicolinate synthase